MPFLSFETVGPYRERTLATGAPKAGEGQPEQQEACSGYILAMTCVFDDEVQILLAGKFDRLLNVFNASRGNRIVGNWREDQQL
jgi:hypothetical protein